MKTLTEWTWIPSEFMWAVGNPEKHAASLYKDLEQDKFWQYNIVINGELVVMGEGKFENLKEAMIKATQELVRLIRKSTHPLTPTNLDA